jgi:HEAT repeat protein
MAAAKASANEFQELERFKKYTELSEDELIERKLLASFIANLCKCVLQTSLYTRDHPQARAGVETTFAAMEALDGSIDEFTFIVSSWREDGEGMAVEGLFDEPIDLSQIVTGTAGEHFERKLHGFCKRNRLISFSVKNTIDQDEFHRFIAVFVEFHVETGSNVLMQEYGQDASGPDFTDKLLRENVINVPIVSEQDMLEAKRRIPWRVRVALSRLRKDLSVIPIYAKASSMELQAAKLRLLSDILRPLRQGSHLRDLFVNLDLISEAIAEFEGIELEVDLIAALNVDRAVELARHLLKEKGRLENPGLGGESPLASIPDIHDVITRQLQLVGIALGSEDGNESANEMLRELFLIGAVTVEMLPKSMRERVSMERWTAAFLNDTAGFLELFGQIEISAAYLQQLPYLITIIPQLIQLQKYEDAQAIIEMLKEHRDGTSEDGFRGRSEAVTHAMENLDNEEVVKLLVEAARTAPPEIREILSQLFVTLGASAIPALVQVLDRSERREILNETGLTFIAMGRDAIDPLVEVLDGSGLRRDTACSILNVLAQIGDATTGIALGRYVRHPQWQVRRAALQAVYQLRGVDATDILVLALDDREAQVVRHAIQLLERLKSRKLSLVTKLIDILNSPEEREEPYEGSVVTAAIGALAGLGNLELGEDLGTIEEQLLSCFDLHGQSKMLALLKRPREESSMAIRESLCAALGQIGDEMSLDRLEDMSDEPSPLIRKHMNRAFRAIEKRLDGAA